MYARAYLENLKKNILFYLFISLIYLFNYRFFGEKRLIHMQEFSLIISLSVYEKKTVWILHYSF